MVGVYNLVGLKVWDFGEGSALMGSSKAVICVSVNHGFRVLGFLRCGV